MESFSELNLSPLLMHAIADLGFVKPSPIQAQALPILLGEPTDFMGLAATGTGKTAAFSLPLLEKIDPTKKGVQVLVLCPTRELALQVAGQITLMGKTKGIKALPIYGGSSYGDQVYGLRQGASVVVGTPGRLVDHMERGTLVLSNLMTIVLDEADEMISMGFKDELEKILAASPRETCKIWLFSATMSREIRSIADEYLKNPKQVQVNRQEMLSGTVEQLYYPTHESNKPEVLCKLIDMAEDFYGLVFCQTKSLVADLTQYLKDRGYKVDCLHGDKDQNAREKTMQMFRDKKVNMLICTDVASRGLDVKDITHVINYSLPRELDNYVHRIGRTARSGKSGFAMSLVTPSHRGLIERIERMTKSRMKEGRIPSRKEIASKKITKVLEGFLAQTNFARATELMENPWKDALSTLTTEEVAGRFLSLMFPEVFVGINNEAPRATMSAKPQTPQRNETQHETRERRPYSSDRKSDAPRARENSEPRRERNSDSRREYKSSDRAESPRRFDRRSGRGDTQREYQNESRRPERQPAEYRSDDRRAERKPSEFVEPNAVRKNSSRPAFGLKKPIKSESRSDAPKRFYGAQENDRRKRQFNDDGGNRPPRRSRA